MTFKRIGILAVACLAANAYALTPTDTPDVEIFMSGASAQDNNIEALFRQLCVAGTLDIFRDNSNPASPGRAHRALFCNITTAKVPGLGLTNPKVLFHKRSAGGSAQGVNPVIAGQAIEAMAIDNGNCVRVGTTREWLCRINLGGDLVLQISDAGVSDVNPELFFSLNTPAGSAPVNPATVAATMNVTPAAALVFGIPVTTDLRDALQEVQRNAFRLPATCNIGDETARCMPSLSRHQIASFFSGQVINWDLIMASDAAGVLRPFTQAVSAVAAPIRKQVAICRRINGSGTQAQFNAKFLNMPCSGFGLLVPAAVSNPLFGPVVVLNSGSGDVELCLNDFNNGTNTSNANPGLQTYWAVGIQSTENNADLANDYRFIKVDGVAPTLQNAANGTYVDWVELTYQWKKPGLPNAPSADQLAILQTIARNAGGPTILGPLNLTQYVHPWGVAGYLALTVNGHLLSANGAFKLINPVTPYTHRPRSYPNLSDCRVPVYDRGAKDTLGNFVLPL